MNSRLCRFGVYLFILISSVLLILKSRTVPSMERAAFLRYTSGLLLVKLKGSDGKDGIYRIFDASERQTVNNVTHKGLPLTIRNNVASGRIVQSGYQLKISRDGSQESLEKMTVPELILLGIPLDPAAMTVADWDALPGIGAAVAAEIKHLCQNNGGLSSLDQLATLSGVGKGRVEKLRRFFK